MQTFAAVGSWTAHGLDAEAVQGAVPGVEEAVGALANHQQAHHSQGRRLPKPASVPATVLVEAMA